MKQTPVSNLVAKLDGARPACALSSRLTFASVKRLTKALPLLLLLLSCVPATTAQTQQTGDGAERLSLKSVVLGEERVILVRTPPGYGRNTERYPVLYMTDGDTHLVHTSGTVNFLARNGRMPEMIIVGIVNTDRTRDLTPTNAALSIPKGQPNPFPTSGGADRFLKFIETELIPVIESRYRTQPFRVLAGHSFGGLFAVHTMLARPELFNSYIAVSPSLQWADELLVKRGEEFLKSHREWKKSLYMTLGNEPGDISEAFRQFREILGKNRPKDFEWDATQFMDEEHGSVVLPSHYWALRRIFDGWQMPRDPATGTVAGGLRGADDHYRKLSQKFGYTIPVPEAVVNQLGYQLLGGGRTDEAIAVFKANVERNPTSANVYDSLAEAYERDGKFDLARQNYEKAYALGKEASDPNTAIFKTNLDRATERMKGSVNAGANK